MAAAHHRAPSLPRGPSAAWDAPNGGGLLCGDAWYDGARRTNLTTTPDTACGDFATLRPTTRGFRSTSEDPHHRMPRRRPCTLTPADAPRAPTSRWAARLEHAHDQDGRARNGAGNLHDGVLTSLHYESHVVAPTAARSASRPTSTAGTNRAALSDRSWAHITRAAPEDEEGAEVDFDVKNVSDDVRGRSTSCACSRASRPTRSSSSSTCRSASPPHGYANMLSNEWDNIPAATTSGPSRRKRKKIKRRMAFHLFTTESAC